MTGEPKGSPESVCVGGYRNGGAWRMFSLICEERMEDLKGLNQTVLPYDSRLECSAGWGTWSLGKLRVLIKKSHREEVFARSTYSCKVFHALNSRNVCKAESRPFWKQRGKQTSEQKRSLASSYHLTGYPQAPHLEEQTAIVFRQHSIV